MVEPAAAGARAMLDSLIAKLTEAYHSNATSDWRWFEATLTYDNAILPLALFAAYAVTGERATLRAARESLEFLEDVCFAGDRLLLVGNDGWHTLGGDKAPADEQAIDATAFVLAFRCAYAVTGDRHYLVRMCRRTQTRNARLRSSSRAARGSSIPAAVSATSPRGVCGATRRTFCRTRRMPTCCGFGA